MKRFRPRRELRTGIRHGASRGGQWLTPPGHIEIDTTGHEKDDVTSRGSETTKQKVQEGGNREATKSSVDDLFLKEHETCVHELLCISRLIMRHQ